MKQNVRSRVNNSIVMVVAPVWKKGTNTPWATLVEMVEALSTTENRV
jgi:hypothetical protein